MTQRIHLGISTCPNDTFAFHGLLTNRIDTEGLTFDIELMDVQELNDRLFAGDFDVAKASFHAALLLTDELGVLPSGSALGFGVGPLLLSAKPGTHPTNSPNMRVLCPGRHTTATLLYRLFHPNEGRLDQTIFSDIMPALQNGTADFGVCIHEGRFTWQEHGLGCVEDLGTVWEQATNTPLPLGGILARHRLGDDLLRRIQRTIRSSLEYGLANRDQTLESMRKYAQEFSDDVLMQHVDLYVNDWTVELGDVGVRSLQALTDKAKEVGILDGAARSVEVVGS